jgi:preprotein translocase subunit YajC
METLILLGLLFLLMWALLIRPQQRRVRQHQNLLSSLQAGDRVVTAGGILGRISEIDDEALTLEVETGVKLRMVRGSISRKIEPPATLTGPEAEPPA